MIWFFPEMQDYSLFTIRLVFRARVGAGFSVMAPILQACGHTDFLPAPLLTYFVVLAPNTN